MCCQDYLPSAMMGWGVGGGEGRKEDGEGECAMSIRLRPLTFVPIVVGILKTQNSSSVGNLFRFRSPTSFL